MKHIQENFLIMLLNTLALLLLFLSTTSIAELYKWVDENGKTHYSDTPPPDKKVKAEVMDIKAQAEDILINKNAAKRPEDKMAALLVLSDIDALWNRPLEDKMSVGLYYIGKECAVPTAMVLPQAKQLHPDFFPSNNVLANMLVSTFVEYRFPARWPPGKSLYKLNDAYSLDVKIDAIDLKACMNKKRSLAKFDLRKYHSSDFKKYKLNLTIKWTLKDKRGKTLYSKTNEGVSNYWQGHHYVNRVYSKALEHAAGQLLSDNEFREFLFLRGESSVESEYYAETSGEMKSDIAQATKEVLKKAKEGLFEIPNSFSHYIMRANFANVLQILQPIKVSVTEYYLHQGAWPSHIGELNNVPQADEKDGVESISLGANGAIIINMTEKFGDGATLYMRPVVSSGMGMVRWECQSTLDISYIPKGMDCQAL